MTGQPYRSVDPPRLVDILPRDPGGEPALGWLSAWRRDEAGGWEGFVRLHATVTGGTWTPSDRLRPRGPLTDDEIRALGGIPSGPDGEPQVHKTTSPVPAPSAAVAFTGQGPTLGAALVGAFTQAEDAGISARLRWARIWGVLALGPDVRDRGARGTAPLRIDHYSATWDRFDAEWNGDRNPDVLEVAYVEDVICADIGFSEPPQFSGDTYTVRLDP